MPVAGTPGAGGGPGGGAGGGGFSGNKKDLDEYTAAVERNVKILRQSKEVLEEEIKVKEENGEATDDLKEELKKLNSEYANNLKILRPLLAERAKELDQFDKLNSKIKGYIGNAKQVASTVKTLATEYYTYNLSVQRAIDATGKFGGQSALARREFESLRTSLNLTREAAQDFGKTWAEGLRLGATTQQLEAMGKQLQAVYGQLGGIQAQKDILAAPMTRQTFQGVTAEKPDVSAILTALQAAQTPEQQEALIGRVPGEEPKAAADAAKFEASSAAIAKTFDDFRHAAGELINRGVGPEGAALLAPVLDIAENVRKIAEVGKSSWSGLSSFFGGAAGAKAVGAGATEAGTVAKATSTAARVGRVARVGGTALKLGKVLSPAILGEIASYGAEAAREHWATEKGSLPDEALKHTGRVGRIAGWAGTGAMIGSAVGTPGVGTAVGATAFGGVAAIAEYGEDIVKGTKDLGHWIGGWTAATKDQKNEQRTLRDVIRESAQATRAATKFMDALNITLKTMPEAIEAGAARRQVEVGKGTIDRTDFAKGQEKIGTNIAASIGKITQSTHDEIGRLEEQREKTLRETTEMGPIKAETQTEFEKRLAGINDEAAREEMREKGPIKEETKEGFDERLAKTGDLFRIAIAKQSQNMQTQLKELNIGGQVDDIMSRMETRQGQLGLERQGAQARYQAGGAVTGNIGEITKYQKEIDRTYNEQAANLQTEAKDARRVLELRKKDIDVQLKQGGLREAEEQALKNEAKDLQVKGEQLERNLKLREAQLQVERRTQEIEALRAKATAYQLTASYRDAKMKGEVAKTQKDWLNVRGGTPEEFEEVARKEAAASRKMATELTKNLPKVLEEANDKASKARKAREIMEAGGEITEGTYKGKGPEGVAAMRALETEAAQVARDSMRDAAVAVTEAAKAEMGAALARVQEQQKQLGFQKRMIELDRDRLTMIGATWQEVMKNTVAGARVAQDELKAAQEELDIARKKGYEGAELLKLETNVREKQNAVVAATTGKQRDFMEKAIAAGFGMGGGTKALPNINRAKVFGEQFINIGGLRVQGPGMQIEQQAAMRRAGMIPGLGPAAQLPGKKGGPARLPGPGPVVAKGEGAAQLVDVSGKIVIVGKLDVEGGNIVGKIEEVSRKIHLSMGQPGAMMG